MKNLTRIIFVALLTVTLSGKTAAAAEKEEKFETNGQTSFYGTYEYDTSEEKVEHEPFSDGKSNGNTSPAKEAKNASSSGHALLPKTGEAGAPEYLYIGLFLCGAVIYLVRHTKRKEEILE